MTITAIKEILAIDDPQERNRRALALLLPDDPATEQTSTPADDTPIEYHLQDYLDHCDDEALLPHTDVIHFVIKYAPQMKLSRLLTLLDIFIATRPQNILNPPTPTHRATRDLFDLLIEYRYATLIDLFRYLPDIRDALDPARQTPSPPGITPPPTLNFYSW